MHPGGRDTWPLVSGRAGNENGIYYMTPFFFSVAQNVFPTFLVCGMVPVFDEQDWKLVSRHIDLLGSDHLTVVLLNHVICVYVAA